MATVNKNFKIKQGLVVEGSTATVGGNNVLVETASDQYIIDLIGGETLVTSVESTQMEVIAGELNIKSGVFDASGAASAAQSAAISAAASDATTKAATAKSEAISAAATDATTKANAAKTAAEATASADATSKANAARTAAEATASADATSKANAAKSGAEATAAAALTAAISTEVSNRNTAISTAVDSLVDGAPALLNTLNELAAAINDDANYTTTITTALGTKANASDVTTALAGKEDKLTSAQMTNKVITGVSGSSYGLVGTSEYLDVKDTNGYNKEIELDIAAVEAKLTTDGYAKQSDITTALSSAQSYADALTTSDVAEGTSQYFTDARAKSSAADLLTGATKTNITITGTGAGLTITAENGVADSTTTDLAEGTNKYFTDERAQDAVGNSLGDGLKYNDSTGSIGVKLYGGQGLTIDGNNYLGINRTETDAWYDSNGAASAAQATASSDATSKANAARTAAEATAAADATSKVAAEATARATAVTNAISTASSDATTKANAAVTSANSYTDTAISTEVTNRNSAISSAISTEVTNRNSAISSAVAAVVDSAPAALDTLKELAAALSDSPSTVTNLTTLVGTKAPLASPALTGVPTAPTAAADTSTTQIATTAFAKAEADAAQAAAEATASADATSKANAARTAAEATASADATSKANAAQTAAEATAATANTAQQNGTTPFTALNINSVAKQVAATLSAPTAGVQTAYSWAKADFRSAEFLVRVGSGIHTEVSKVLLTLDTADNIAITEYGIVATNVALSTVSAAISGSNVELRVTTLNNTSVVTVMGTLIK